MKLWKVKYSDKAKRQILTLDNSVRKNIERFFNHIHEYSNPRDVGKALTGQYAGLWRYRVGDYRLICSIHDNILTVEVIKIGHRSNVYKR